MSTAPRSVSHPALRGPERRGSPAHAAVEAVEPVISGLAVTWRLTRRSLGDRAPSGTSRLLELTVRIDGVDTARPTASVVAVDPGSSEVVVLDAIVPELVEVIPDIRSEIHIECPGVLHATVVPVADRPAGGWRLVYARTPLLASLGVPGGRAEPVGVVVRY